MVISFLLPILYIFTTIPLSRLSASEEEKAYSEDLTKETLYLLVIHDSKQSHFEDLVRILESELNPETYNDTVNSTKRYCQFSFGNGQNFCYEDFMPRIKVVGLKVSKNIPAILVEVDRIVRSHALFAIISTSEYTETYVALATIAGQYLIPVIDAAAENRKRYFALKNVQLYFHVRNQITRSKEIGGLIRVLSALSLRTMAVIYEEREPYDVLYEEFTEILVMRSHESQQHGEHDQTFSVTKEYNLTLEQKEGFSGACKSLLRNDQTTLVIIGSAQFHKKVYKECEEYINKHRPALISSSDIVTANQEMTSQLPNGILTLKAANQSMNKQLLDAGKVAQLSLYYIYELINSQDEDYKALFKSMQEIYTVESGHSKALKTSLLREIKSCFERRNYQPLCNTNIPETFLVQNLYTSEASVESDESASNLKSGQNKPIKTWHGKGKVTDRYVEINSIKWTGNQYFNMKKSQKPQLKITIATIEPFLIWREPNNDKSCDFGQVCYPYLRGEDADIESRVDDIVLNFTVSDEDVKCCDGLEVELIDRLSKDMHFEYILYFGNFPAGLVKIKSEPVSLENLTESIVGKRGTRETVEWQGMVGSVYHGQADLSIGSISITNERSQFVRFSSPYFYSGFAIMVAKKPPEPEKFAFLKPMSWRVWLTILLCCKGVAIAIAYTDMLSNKIKRKTQMEEFQKDNPQLTYKVMSSFTAGQISTAHTDSPSNRNIPQTHIINHLPSTAARSKLREHTSKIETNSGGKANSDEQYWYGMSSSLQSVFGILFLHTLPTKMPRGFATKCILFLWAGISLLVVACYTANLASFMTGRLTYLDLDIAVMINSQKVYSYGAVKGSSVQKYITEQWAHMGPMLANNLVGSASDAFLKLKNGTLDAYFDDAPIVYWEVANDPDCKLVAVGNTFGDDYYGIVVSNMADFDGMYVTLNEHINRYRDSLYLDKLREKWLEDYRSCPSRDDIQNSLGLSHIGGLFYVLMATCCICFLVLLLELMVEKGVERVAHNRGPPQFLKHHSLQLYAMWKHKQKIALRHREGQRERERESRKSTYSAKDSEKDADNCDYESDFKPGLSTRLSSSPVIHNPYVNNGCPKSRKLSSESIISKIKPTEKELIELYKELHNPDDGVQYEIHV